MKYTERCEGIKASGTRCKCYGVMQVNGLWYCKIHGEKELRAVAMTEARTAGSRKWCRGAQGVSELKLKSGRVLRAHQGILGLAPDLELTEGYDGTFWFDEEDDENKPLTSEERAGLADMMIDRWQRWKAGA